MKRIILFVFISFICFSCAQDSGTTLLSGKFDQNPPESVRIRCERIDTTLTVTEGTFSINIPTNRFASGIVIARPMVSVSFVPDGGTLVADFSGETPELICKNTKSINHKMAQMNEYIQSSRKTFGPELKALRESGASEEEVNARAKQFREEFVATIKSYIEDNKGNIVGLMGIRHISNDLELEDLVKMIDSMDEAVREQSSMQRLKNTTLALIATSEGKMFTDFEVETFPGKIEKLSDYVGKGKYILVDFWASWCGPCKKEIPIIKDVYNRFHGEDFDILSIAVNDKVQASLDTAKELGVNWNEMVNAQNIPAEVYGVTSIPHIILFGPDGTILKRGLRGENIAKEVAKYVKEK